jgi:ABC-2 type transport system ATP-binding protein
MIEAHELSKRYGGKLAVDRLSFTVRPGTVTGFLGPNGSGKSTTMRLVLGLDAPTGGGVTVNGRSYGRIRAPLREVGSLLEARAAHPGRTAYHHLLALAQANRIQRSRVGEVIELVGLAPVAHKRTKGFSLGMGQRLGIAAALLGDPGVLMLDEPVNGLDTEGIRWIRELLKGLAAEGRTVFVSSHLMSEMEQTADHLIVIGQGRLIADTATRDFLERDGQGFTLVRSPQDAELRRLLEAAGASVRPDPRGGWRVRGLDAAAVGTLAAEHRIVLYELTSRHGTLEEIYTRMTQDSTEYRTDTRTESRADTQVTA